MILYPQPRSRTLAKMEEQNPDSFKRWILTGILSVSLGTFSSFAFNGSPEARLSGHHPRVEESHLELDAERALESIRTRMAKTPPGLGENETSGD